MGWKETGIAAGLVAGGWSIVCAAALVVAPNDAMAVGRLLFHGVAVSQPSLEVVGVVAGALLWFAGGFVSGAFFEVVRGKL